MKKFIEEDEDIEDKDGNKYKIIISYIQDLSVEIPSPESLITIRNTTPEYRMSVDISTKPAKRKMVEVLTTLTYANPNKKKLRVIFKLNMQQ